MSFKALTQAERIAGLEVQVDELKAEVKSMNYKLDQLLALKYKGAGALWLITLIGGTSVVAFASSILNWIKH